MSTHGVGLFSLLGGYAAGMIVSIPSGYADATELDPGIEDAVLRYTGHLYENREILVANTDATDARMDDRYHLDLLDAAGVKGVDG